MSISIKLQRTEDLPHFLELNGFEVDDLGNDVIRVQRAEELPVFLKISGSQIFYEVDLGNITEIADKELLLNLLDLNTEILPVSFGLDTTNPDDHRLVLVESRETDDMNDNELLSVFDALELAVDRAEELFSRINK